MVLKHTRLYARNTNEISFGCLKIRHEHQIMKTKIAAFFCSLSMWAAAQTTATGGVPPAPGPNNNHGYATPGGGEFVTPGNGFITPGTGNHGFASPGQTNGFVKPGNGFVAPGNGFITPGSGNRFANPGNGFVNPQQPPTNSPPKT
jgi:hypothetical protein